MRSAALPEVLQTSSSRSITLRGELSRRTATLFLLGIAVVSSVLRIMLASRMHGPFVFNDELIYQRLAQSIGLHGRLELFSNRGFSYSPLYPVLLSPIFAFGASAPLAYSLIKNVNAILLSLSIFPVYRVARFVLPRNLSLLAAVLVALAPLMAYSSFTMSENLAFPLCMVAIWALLAAIVKPSPRADATLLAAILLTTAARIQLGVLFPAALTAIAVVGLIDRNTGESSWRSLLRKVRAHTLLFGVAAAGLTVIGVLSLSGHGIYAMGGGYSQVGRAGPPDLWKLVEEIVEHLAGIDLAVGVGPFVAALAIGFAFVRAGAPRGQLPFAAAAASLTSWLLVETAWEAAKFDGTSQDPPRIHERFLIYVVPLFLVALLAAYRFSAQGASGRHYLGAAAVAALLPALIPYHTVINPSIVADSFGLAPFAVVHPGNPVPIPYAALVAVAAAATFGLLYVYARVRLRSVVILLLIPFVVVFGLQRSRIEAGGNVARSALPRHTDWVDRVTPTGSDVIVVSVAGSRASALETAFANLSIDRAYALCGTTFGPDFGELHVTIDAAGQLRDSAASVVRARFAVVPTSLGVRGRVLARNPEGRQVLVAPTDGVLSVSPTPRPKLPCQATAS